MKGNRLDTRRVRSDGKMLGGHHGCSGYSKLQIAEGRSHVRDQVPGAFGREQQRGKEKVCSEAATISPLPIPAMVPSEPGRLNGALHRMVRQGFAKDAKVIADAIRNLEPLDGKNLERSRELLLKALHHRGPFAPQWDFHTPRGIRRPAIA